MGYSDRNFQGHLYKFTIFLSIRTVEKAQYMTYDKVRLTVASVVEKNESYLMVEEIDSGNTVINQPAGHVEAGEDIVQASIRETYEETGWHVKPIGFLGFSQHFVMKTGVTYYRANFSAKPIQEDLKAKIDSDIVRVMWLSFEEIEARQRFLRSPMVLMAIKRYRQKTIFPLELIINSL